MSKSNSNLTWFRGDTDEGPDLSFGSGSTMAMTIEKITQILRDNK